LKAQPNLEVSVVSEFQLKLAVIGPNGVPIVARLFLMLDPEISASRPKTH
jgi:hypothetical protein